MTPRDVTISRTLAYAGKRMNSPRRDSGYVEGGRGICHEGVRLLDSKYGVHRLPLGSETEQRLGRM